MGNIIFFFLAVIETGLMVWSLIKETDHTKERGIVRIGELMIISAFMLTGVLEWGFRYYIIMLVLFCQALSGVIKLVKKNRKEVTFRIGRTVGSSFGRILGYYMALLLAIIFPQSEAITPDGPMTVAYSKFTWADKNRIETFAASDSEETAPSRMLTVEFWYPEVSEDSEETYPLVIFSHGANGFSGSNLSTFQQLASHGYVVASIGHTYHALYTQDEDNIVTTIDMEFFNQVMSLSAMADDEQKYNLNQEWLMLRVDDENFVLDTVLQYAMEAESTAPFNRIDTDKIGLFGHSLGGASSAVLGRTRDDIDAVIDIDGTMLGEAIGYQDGEVILTEESYPIPLLNLYAEDHYEAAQAELANKPDSEYYNFHATEHAVDAYEVVLLDAGHLNFSDLPLFSPLLAEAMGVGTVDARYGIETMNHIVLTFFDSILKAGVTPDLQKEY